MTDTLRSVLTQGADRYLNGELSDDEFIQGVILALAESPKGKQKEDELIWLAQQLVIEI